MRERDIEIEILKWLNKQPEAFAFKVNQSGYHDGTGWRKRNNGSLRGVSDIIGIWKERPLAIEVKSKTGRPTKEQIFFLNHFASKGGLVLVARSLDDVKRFLSPT